MQQPSKPVFPALKTCVTQKRTMLSLYDDSLSPLFKIGISVSMDPDHIRASASSSLRGFVRSANALGGCPVRAQNDGDGLRLHASAGYLVWSIAVLLISVFGPLTAAALILYFDGLPFVDVFLTSNSR